MKDKQTIILGAGISGLAAGIKTKAPIYEVKNYAGGLCCSYQINDCRFESFGGYWIFGHNQGLLNYINKLSSLNWYKKKSAVFFSKQNLFVPYPLQKNLSFLPKDLQNKISHIQSSQNSQPKYFKSWLLQNFGKSLCDLFFFPFNNRYTAGLYKRISPPDTYKTPIVNKSYNDMFAYPKNGLNDLIKKLAEKSNIRFNKEVVKIDTKKKLISFSDQTQISYTKIFSTIPLNKMVKICGLDIKDKQYPYTSILVVNIYAQKGKKHPNHHWLYLSDSTSGFHRVGFYSNVTPWFLPKGKKLSHTAIYAEKAFLGGKPVSKNEIKRNEQKIIKELIKWEFIKEPEVINSNWIETAYTWELPNSNWRQIALEKLKKHNIIQIGRYGTWKFQGMLDCIEEGFLVET